MDLTTKNMSSLLNLPTEIQVSIANACSIVDTQRLCETCRLLNGRLLPQLYRTVDLSSHNVNKSCEPWGLDGGEDMVLPTFSERYWEDFDKSAFARQKLFLETMQRNPRYAKHVYKLHWTILDTSGHFWGERKTPNSYDESGEENQDLPLYVPEDEQLWRTFQSLINVTHIDLCWVRAWREVTLPEFLFPSATSIRLSGCMSREFVTCILRPQSQGKSNLTHLELNDLSQWSEINPSLPVLPHIRDIQAYYEEHEPDHASVRKSRQMMDALDPLIGHCQHLTSLRIAILGPCEEPGTGSREERLYQSCARFIDSVRKTLRNLDFEQGYSFNEQAGWEDPFDFREKIFPRPMDRMFARYILPVFLKGSWPCMEKIGIRGVGETDRELTRDFPLTETELTSADVAYTKIDPGWRGERECWTFNMVVISFPSTVQMQLDLQRLVPQATIVVETDGEQDFESFMEDSHGFEGQSQWA